MSAQMHPRRKTVFLMYHELGRPGLAAQQSAASPYLVAADVFRMQMRAIRSLGLRGLSVSEAMRYPEEPSVCITFDDGYASDWTAAAPILREFGFHATAYVTAGFIGTPGYLTADQLRELDASGVEIGCHSMTHPDFTVLPDAELPRELGAARVQIEAVLGHGVEHFSIPHGRYDQRTLAEAGRAGFRTVANSRPHANGSATGPFELGRVAIGRDVALVDFVDVCGGRTLWRKQLADGARRNLRGLFGACSALRAVAMPFCCPPPTPRT